MEIDVLWLGETPVAELHVTEGEFPWLGGTLTPLEGFSLLRWLDDDARGTSALDEAAMTAAGWPFETWILVSERGERHQLCALRRRAPGPDGEREVWWRFGLLADEDSESS